MSSSKTPRRRVIISSDEDSDIEEKKPDHSDIMSEDDDEVVNESVVAESDDEEEEVDESVVAASDEEAGDTPSTPAPRTGREGSLLVASTPINKKSEEHVLNETFDQMSIGERSAASRSNSNSSIDTNDRERSFHGKEVEDSPISKRLNAQSDIKSKQALRERLLRKQAVTARGSGDCRESGDRSSSLLNSTLSPIGLKPIPKRKDEDNTRSPGSEMDTRSPHNKSGSTIPPVSREASMSEESNGSRLSSRGESIDGSRSEGKMDSSRGSCSTGTDKENEGKKVVRKKLNMDLAAVKKEKEEEEKVRKFMTPRKGRTVKIEDSDEEEEKEEDVKTEAYPNIESDEEKEGKKEEDAVIDISDSDEEKDVNKKETTFDVYDSEKEETMPQLKKEVKDEETIFLTSSPARSTKPSVSSSSMASSTGLHPTTHKTYTEDDVKTMEKDLARLMTLLGRSDMKLPDGGALLRTKIEALTTKIENARLAQPARRVAPPEVKGRLQLIDPPRDVDQYNKVVVDDGLGKKKLTGGVMTSDRIENVKRITTDTLDKMHKEVTSQPDEEETATPRGLRVELMRHQKTGLTWMLWRERQAAPGGILADDMGLGKTISMISLMMHTKNERVEKENEEDEKYEKMQKRYEEKCKQARLVPSHSTLVIAPASVIFQWEAEINKRVKGSRLSVHVFHGPKTKREDRPKKLAKYDIVITTYNIITSELTEKVNLTNDSDDESESDQEDARFGKKAAVAADGKNKTKVSKSQISVLTKVHWERIILDEAHQIKNRNSLISKAVCRLPGRNKWCLTGTPVHNNLYDLFSLVRFIKVHPFDELTLWKENIMDPRNGAARLNTLVKSLLLRRMKNQVDTKTNKPLVALAPKNYEIHELSLEGLEMGIYKMMFNAVKTQVKGFIDAQKDKEDMELFGRARRKKTDKSKDEDAEPVVNPFLSGPREVDQKDKFQAMSCILVLLLRLRQAAVHLSLTKEALDLSTFEGLSMDTNDEILDAELSQLSLDETEAEEKKGKVATARDIEAIFSKRHLSTKIRLLLDKLDHAVESGDKCVVVSQWTSVLSIIEHHIMDRGIEYTQITGEIATGDRQERVDSFNKVGGGAQVMLLSLTAGGVGLNLVGGNHLFLVDLHWNPALESQACDRIYRMGQTKNVFIHKLISKHTVEEVILALQGRKSALAKSVLEGAADKALNKLSIADLKLLFDLDGEQRRKELLDEAAAKAQQQYPQGAAAAAAARAATLPRVVPPPLAIHSTAALNYRNAVYGRDTGASGSKRKDDPPVITL